MVPLQCGHTDGVSVTIYVRKPFLQSLSRRGKKEESIISPCQKLEVKGHSVTLLLYLQIKKEKKEKVSLVHVKSRLGTLLMLLECNL